MSKTPTDNCTLKVNVVDKITRVVIDTIYIPAEEASRIPALNEREGITYEYRIDYI